MYKIGVLSGAPFCLTSRQRARLEMAQLPNSVVVFLPSNKIWYVSSETNAYDAADYAIYTIGILMVLRMEG